MDYAAALDPALVDPEELKRRLALSAPAPSAYAPASSAPAPEYAFPETPTVDLGESPKPSIMEAQRGTMQAEPQPKWSDYAPAEKHGLSKVGSILAGFLEPTDKIINRLPQERAKGLYDAATTEWNQRRTNEQKITAANQDFELEDVKATNAQKLQKQQDDAAKERTVITADSKTPTDRQSDIQNYLKANNLPDTPANQEKAREEIAKRGRAPATPTDKDKDINEYLAANKLTDIPANRQKAREAIEKRERGNEAIDLSPEALDAAAKVWITTGQMPPLGMGNAAMRALIMNHAALLMKGGSDTSSEIADNQAAFNVAKSPMQTTFFGSANSLLDKNGTLDQLTQWRIPDNTLPALNSVEDWLNLQAGGGELSGYAATALGVADDYAKVMGGGQGSDTAREQALHLIAAAKNSDARAKAIKGIRDAVSSQKWSRIGKNKMLQKMYGGTEVRAEEAGADKSKSAVATNTAETKVYAGFTYTKQADGSWKRGAKAE